MLSKDEVGSRVQKILSGQHLEASRSIRGGCMGFKCK